MASVVELLRRYVGQRIVPLLAVAVSLGGGGCDSGHRTEAQGASLSDEQDLPRGVRWAGVVELEGGEFVVGYSDRDLMVSARVGEGGVIGEIREHSELGCSSAWKSHALGPTSVAAICLDGGFPVWLVAAQREGSLQINAVSRGGAGLSPGRDPKLAGGTERGVYWLLPQGAGGYAVAFQAVEGAEPKTWLLKGALGEADLQVSKAGRQYFVTIGADNQVVLRELKDGGSALREAAVEGASSDQRRQMPRVVIAGDGLEVFWLEQDEGIPLLGKRSMSLMRRRLSRDLEPIGPTTRLQVGEDARALSTFRLGEETLVVWAEGEPRPPHDVYLMRRPLSEAPEAAHVWRVPIKGWPQAVFESGGSLGMLTVEAAEENEQPPQHLQRIRLVTNGER